MATITSYPLRDPETGMPLDNLETMPADVIALLRDRGLSDAEISTYAIELHDARDEAKQLLRLITTPDPPCTS